MADPFLGEIRPLPYNFAPFGWASCQGQILSISQNTALFSILGTQFGGNGVSNFALPNLQGAVPIGQGQGAGLSPHNVGDAGGVENVTLQPGQMASHTHPLGASASGATSSATSAVPAEGHGGGRGGSFNVNMYAQQAPSVTLSPSAVTSTGGGAPHNNMQPSLTINWCIAMQGIYPPRS